jgi:hypothetical protein
MDLMTVKDLAKSMGVDTRAVYQTLSAKSLERAIREQGLSRLVEECRRIIPNIADQYTEGFIPEEYERYWEPKMRGLHAFQVQCMLDAIAHLKKDNLVLVDIGDSCGNHGRYLNTLTPPNKISRVISVNLDPAAIEKVKAKGQEAILCRAEELDLGQQNVDLFMSFETVEHLTDPARFFYKLAVSGKSEYFLMTVPYVAASRVGLSELRSPMSLPEKIYAEALHIFEFSAEDWTLLARFGGWKPVFTRIYRQYPQKSPLRLTAPLWKKLDYEGFFGVLLKRDLTVANRYQAW